MGGAVASLKVEDSKLCTEDVVFEIVCTCNLKALVIAKNGVVFAPAKYAGMTLEEIKKGCGICLEISDDERQYLLIFYTLKIGLENLVKIITDACKQKMAAKR